MPLVAIAAIGIGSSIVGGVMAHKAASAQASAADRAAQLAHEDQQASLAFQKQQWEQQQANEAPWLKAGGAAETQLSDLMGPGGELAQPWGETFQAPTAATEQNDPGYQFRLDQGMQALQNSAAARGGLLSGGTAKDIAKYSQDYASNEYGNVYGRAFNEYSTRYNQFQQAQANKFNRLSSLAGSGQVAAGQLGAEGQAASQNVANINLTNAAQQGQYMQNAGAARASGYVGMGNAITQGIGGIGQYLMLRNLLGTSNPATNPTANPVPPNFPSGGGF